MRIKDTDIYCDKVIDNCIYIYAFNIDKAIEIKFIEILLGKEVISTFEVLPCKVKPGDYYRLRLKNFPHTFISYGQLIK